MRSFIYKFDMAVAANIKLWPLWLKNPMLAITNVGQPLTVIFFALGLMVWEWRQGVMSLVLSGAIILGTVVISSMLKLVLRRARPLTEYARALVFASYSFPSGHSTAATVGFGFLAYLSWLLMPQPWGLLLAAILSVFVLFIGISRVYLGAHYPSDVVGGFLLGGAGLAAIVFLVQPLQ